MSKIGNRKVMYRYSHGIWNGSSPVDILFVGDAPGEADYILRQPFVGDTGSEFNDILDESLDVSIRYLITNAVLCTPFTDDTLSAINPPSVQEYTNCRKHLELLLKIAQPKVVVAVGKVAERSLKKLVDCFKTVTSPSAILRSTHPDYERNRVVLALRTISDRLTTV